MFTRFGPGVCEIMSALAFLRSTLQVTCSLNPVHKTSALVADGHKISFKRFFGWSPWVSTIVGRVTSIAGSEGIKVVPPGGSDGGATTLLGSFGSVPLAISVPSF